VSDEVIAFELPPIAHEPAYPGRYPPRRRVSARRALNRAVRGGDLPRPGRLPCLDCGRRGSRCHHRLGYHPDDRPHAVPVCAGCHLREHDRLGGHIGCSEEERKTGR
jgi:hypothetical protein